MRVATYNVRTGRALDGSNSWPLRRRATLRTVQDLDADVVGVQEAYDFQLRYLVKHLDDVTAVGDGRDADRGGEHTPLLVRRGWRIVEHVTHWFGDTPDEPGSRLGAATLPRIATIAVVETGDGQRLQVINTHLDHKYDVLRRRSARQLLDWLDPALPQVLLGDFNATARDPLFGLLARAGLRRVVPEFDGATFHGFTGTHHGKPIDHILVSASVEVVSAKVAYDAPGERLGSDHWPVVADVRLSR